MNEMAPEADALTKVARNLTAIEDMTNALLTQAVHKANDKLMPGGTAMVALASVASPEAWEHIFEAAEGRGHDTSHIEDEDDTWEPPLQTLLFWSEQWRDTHGYMLDGRPTIASETNFIRWCLNWAWDNEPRFLDFAHDMHQARLRLENVLYAGTRAERSRVVCSECEKAPRLVKVYATPEDKLPAEEDIHWWHLTDHHKCPNKECRTRFDDSAFRRAHAKQLRSQGAERFVSLRDAVGTLRAQGRPERTIRKWFEDCQVEAWCDTATREVWVWWPDLWRLHLSTATRRREVA